MECEVDGCSNPTLITGTSGHARTRACGAHICKSCGGEVVPIAHSKCIGCGPKFCELDGCNSHVSVRNAYNGAGRLCHEHCCSVCSESNEGGKDRTCPKCLKKIEASRQQGQRHRQCNYLGCKKTVASSTTGEEIYCRRHKFLYGRIPPENLGAASTKGGSVRPHEVDRLRASYSGKASTGKPLSTIINERVSDVKKWWRDLDTESSASRSDAVRHATELYLLWQDGGDNDMPVDPKVRKHYTELAQKHPACSVEQEASSWLRLQVKTMSDAEIRQAVNDAVARIPNTWHRMVREDRESETHRENINVLIAYKNGLL